MQNKKINQLTIERNKKIEKEVYEPLRKLGYEYVKLGYSHQLGSYILKLQKTNDSEVENFINEFIVDFDYNVHATKNGDIVETWKNDEK